MTVPVAAGVTVQALACPSAATEWLTSTFNTCGRGDDRPAGTKLTPDLTRRPCASLLTGKRAIWYIVHTEEGPQRHRHTDEGLPATRGGARSRSATRRG